MIFWTVLADLAMDTPSKLSQRYKLKSTVCDADGNVTHYVFRKSRDGEKYYEKNRDDIRPATEESMDLCICGAYWIDINARICNDFSRYESIGELMREIGFVYESNWNVKKKPTFQIPTIEYAQAKLDALGLPIILREVDGISTDEEFLSVQLSSLDKIVVVISKGVEFFHDMTAHLIPIIRFLVEDIVCTHYSSQLTQDYPKTVLKDKHGSYYNVFVYGQKKFAEAFERICALENKEGRSVLMTYLASLYDIYTADSTKNYYTADRVECLLRGRHEIRKVCSCYHATGKNDLNVFDRVYSSEGFGETLMSAVKLVRWREK